MERRFKPFAALFLSMIILFSVGCASFEPALRQDALSRRRLPTATSSQKGIEVSIEEFVTPTKSMQAFEAVVASYGVLPLLIRIENNGSTNYRLARGQVKASLGGEALPVLVARDAATQGAAKGYQGNALGWTLATGPFFFILAPLTLTASSAHTASVNRKIEEQFGTLELPDALIRSNQSVTGFVYFKLPPVTWKLENLTVEVEPIDDSNEEPLSFKFFLPPLDIPVPREMQERPIQNRED